ncbi:MAG: putative porin [Bacteroidota bacterium]|nr:putative porin [Bacteroidota bacterium]MDP3144445.1 putative porin [Bacteroidota bacterium]
MPTFFKQKKIVPTIKKLWFWLFFCSAFISSSQSFYSTDSKYLSSKTEKNNLLSKYRYTYPDTSINNLHNYFPRNFLGNVGLPSPTYLLTYGTNNIGFNFYTPPTQNDIYTESQVEYYRSKGPYANLIGVAGSKKFQAFKMLFTHTYKEKVNVTLKFSRYTSQGFYLKQQTYTNNFYLSSNATSKNNRLGYYFYILTNGNKNKENGGILQDSLTDKTLLENKELLAVRLNGANRENKEIKVMFNPFIKLNKGQDSTTKLNHFIQSKSTFASNIYKYNDDNIAIDKYYTIMYLDTAKTRDSSHVLKILNEINYSAITTNSNFAISVGYKNEINHVWQKADSLFFNHIATADIAYRKSIRGTDSLNTNGKEIESFFNFQYVFGGANIGNYKVESRTILNLNKSKNRLIYFNLLAENRSADYIYNYWISNHFSWFNNGYHSQQQTQAVLGFYLNKNITTSVFVQNINNYLFFDNVALPRQYSKPITNVGVRLTYTKVFLKHIGLSLNYIFQNTTNTTYIRMPRNQGIAKLFYTGNLFKNNLQLQIGSQLQAYQSFYSYGYMPATQTFYLQEGFKTETYPFVDVYINARIRPVSFFLKVENALYGFAGTKYALTQGYYQTDRAFRFGISWSFFD